MPGAALGQASDALRRAFVAASLADEVMGVEHEPEALGDRGPQGVELGGVDLTDAADVRRLVRLFVLPGIRALRVPQSVDATSPAGTGVRTRRTRQSHSPLPTKGEAS